MEVAGVGLPEALALSGLAGLAVWAIARTLEVPLHTLPLPGRELSAIHAALEALGAESWKASGALVAPRGPVTLTFTREPGGARARISIKAWYLTSTLTLALLEPPVAVPLALYAAYRLAEARSLALNASRRAAAIEEGR